MQSLAAVAIGILVVASILVAVRLLALHRRTGAAPELLLGSMLLLSVGVGYPLMIAADRTGGDRSVVFQGVATLAINIGFCFLFEFTRRVFRPQAVWARAFAGAAAITMLATVLHRWAWLHAHGALHASEEPFREMLLQTGPVAVAYVWTAWEALRYHALMRRRSKLGLADPVMCNRFLVWGLMASSATAGVLLSLVAGALRVNVFSTPWILVASSCTGLGQSVGLVLAFVPPRSYTAWVRARAIATGVA
jgi:hypothetical protein